MIIEILKRSMTGIAFGGIATFIALTIMKFNHIDGTISEVWMHMLASMIIGIYFGLASFIYESDTWSPLKKVVIHFCLSIIVYFIVALTVGWIPFNFLSIMIGTFMFIIVYGIYWTGSYLYFKKMEDTMNKHLKK